MMRIAIMAVLGARGLPQILQAFPFRNLHGDLIPAWRGFKKRSVVGVFKLKRNS
jgi:hypothetical protein